MKILYVTTISNTINAFLIPHIKMLIESGHKVDVAFNIDQEVNQEIYNLGCKVHIINFNRSLLKNNYINLVREMKDIITVENYDIVHTHTPIASAIVRIASRNLVNVKVFYTAHGFHFYRGAPLKNWLLFYPIERYLSKYTDILITINEEDYKRAQTFKGYQVEYIPGVGIDLDNIQVNKEKVSKLKKDLELSTKDFVLCSIGELNDNKNHNVVLEALSKVNNKNIKYIVAGAGELKEDLTKKVNELNIKDQVILLGFSEDIYELLDISDVFIFPSHREGLSRSLMEAMAMGKPIIASDIRGNKDLIDDKEGGLLFNPRNAARLSEHIITMLNNESFRKTASTYNTEKVKQFSLENVLNKMSKIY